MKIGVLALQGDFAAHRRRLEATRRRSCTGAQAGAVRRARRAGDSRRRIHVPSSSCWATKAFASSNDFVHTRPTFGTCAGAIMLARNVENPDQPGLDAIDITVRRNAYGRQIDSTIITEPSALGSEPLEMVFIRAPRIERVGEGVEVLAKPRQLSRAGAQGQRHGRHLPSRAVGRSARSRGIPEAGEGSADVGLDMLSSMRLEHLRRHLENNTTTTIADTLIAA